MNDVKKTFYSWKHGNIIPRDQKTYELFKEIKGIEKEFEIIEKLNEYDNRQELIVLVILLMFFVFGLFFGVMSVVNPIV